MTSGCYEILNSVDGKRYIGSSVDLTRRERMHWNHLARGKHHSHRLQRAWNKHGGSAFKFRQILTCAKSMLLFYEQQLLDGVRPEYNLAPTAGSALGVKRSDEFCAAQSRRKGEKRSAEAREHMRQSHLGKKQSVKTRIKRAFLMKGNKNFAGLTNQREVARNRKTNHLLTLNSVTLCIVEWAEKIGIKQRTLAERLRRGWTVEQALTAGVRVHSRWNPR